MTYDYALHSPESHIPRSDSRNPASTCHGITVSGRPCRREVSKKTPLSPSDAAASYCWQHRDQVRAPSPSHHGATQRRARPRDSVDTLLSRMGSLRIAASPASEKPPRSARLSSVVPSELEKRRSWQLDQQSQHTRRTQLRTPTFWSRFCCLPSIREQAHQHEINGPLIQQPAPRPVVPRQSESRHQHNVLISAQLPCTTQAALAMELAKPLSAHDEPGYIYIFRLSAGSLAPSPDSLGEVRDGTVLLKIGRAANVHRRMAQWQRQCGLTPRLVRWYPYMSGETLAALSPTRRGAELAAAWHAKPAAASASASVSASTPPPPVRKVPLSHRVERLIHVELSAQRVTASGACMACGRMHREWFEVAATAEAIAAVDAVVKKWCLWADGVAASINGAGRGHEESSM